MILDTIRNICGSTRSNTENVAVAEKKKIDKGKERKVNQLFKYNKW